MSAVSFLDLFVGGVFFSLIACAVYALTFLRDGEEALTPDEMRDEAEDFVRRCVVGIECTDAEILRAAQAAYEAFTWRIDAIRLSGFRGLPASVIEARSAETGNTDSARQGESAVAKPDAQP